MASILLQNYRHHASAALWVALFTGTFLIYGLIDSVIAYGYFVAITLFYCLYRAFTCNSHLILAWPLLLMLLSNTHFTQFLHPVTASAQPLKKLTIISDKGNGYLVEGGEMYFLTDSNVLGNQINPHLLEQTSSSHYFTRRYICQGPSLTSSCSEVDND